MKTEMPDQHHPRTLLARGQTHRLLWKSASQIRSLTALEDWNHGMTSQIANVHEFSSQLALLRIKHEVNQLLLQKYPVIWRTGSEQDGGGPPPEIERK